MTTKTDEITREFFDSMLISPRYLDADLPSLEMELWGEKFKTPIMTAALSHLHNTCEDGICCASVVEFFSDCLLRCYF